MHSHMFCKSWWFYKQPLFNDHIWLSSILSFVFNLHDISHIIFLLCIFQCTHIPTCFIVHSPLVFIRQYAVHSTEDLKFFCCLFFIIGRDSVRMNFQRYFVITLFNWWKKKKHEFRKTTKNTDQCHWISCEVLKGTT